MNDTPHPHPNLRLDHDRERRCGFPEVVLGAGKTVEEILAAADGLHRQHGRVLVTRADDHALAALAEALPGGESHPRSGCFLAGAGEPTHGPVALISAGTSDEPVAEECAVTLRARGVAVARLADCGVAGIHRLLDNLDVLEDARAAVVVAGMDAALASVIGGLVAVPVIGVPTSTGYGVADGGRTALHAMLASCAAGLTVVNIDNGFGAGFAAASIARQSPPLPAGD